MFEIELVKRLRDIHYLSGNDAGFVFFARRLYAFREFFKSLHEHVSFVVRYTVLVEISAFGRAFFEERTATRVSVLNVRTRLPVKVEHLVVIEYDVLYPAVEKHRKHSRAYAYLFGGKFSVFEVGILFRDYLARFRDRGVEHVLKEYHSARTSRKRAVFERYHTVRDVHHIVRPGLAHKAQHLEYLFEMKVLLIRYNVQTLIEIVSLFAVYRRR